jgi:hypothetical protein
MLVSVAAFAFVRIRSEMAARWRRDGGEVAARCDSHLSAAFPTITTLGDAGARHYARLASDADEDGMDGASGARGRASSKSYAEATTPEPPPSPRAGGQVASFFIARRGSRSGLVGEAPSHHGPTAHRRHSDSTPTTGTAQAPASSDPMHTELREDQPAPPSRSFLDETQEAPSRSFLDETQEAADNLMFEADRQAHELLFEAQREADAILNAARRISAAHSPSSLPRPRSSLPASLTPGAHENDYLDSLL